MKNNKYSRAAHRMFWLLLGAPAANAGIQGITGDTSADCTDTGATVCFELTAKAAHIALGDGNSLLAWGYADAALGPSAPMQYPGPTLIVNQGDAVSITLRNELPDYLGNPNPTSVVFPGQIDVGASGGTAGLLTREAAPGGSDTVTYTFTASNAGTYLYQSGSQPELQIEMGLVGALIVRPTGYDVGSTASHDNRRAYPAAATNYDREYLFFLTEMDRSAHDAVDQDLPTDAANFDSTLWFINGRNGPDTMHGDNVGWLPHQPYGALAQAKPSERVLMRIIGAGRERHPFHHHGNNAWLIARDGRVLHSGAVGYPAYPDYQTPIAAHAGSTATLPDQSISNYTIQVVPGSTYDAIFTWTGFGLNWDIYGNQSGHMSGDCGAALATEDPNSHCNDLTVVLPEQQSLTFGGLWTGSPYLGGDTALPPGEGGLNPNFGFSYMWHSHTERELVNDDIFPGGMMTMMIIEHPDVCIPDSTTVCP